jgi:hypothetical protein
MWLLRFWLIGLCVLLPSHLRSVILASIWCLATSWWMALWLAAGPRAKYRHVVDAYLRGIMGPLCTLRRLVSLALPLYLSARSPRRSALPGRHCSVLGNILPDAARPDQPVSDRRWHRAVSHECRAVVCVFMRVKRVGGWVRAVIGIGVRFQRPEHSREIYLNHQRLVASQRPRPSQKINPWGG